MAERTELHSRIIPPAARQEFIDHPTGLAIELEAMDTVAIAEKIRSYPRTAEGFEDFCRDLIQSSDPHTIQVLLFAADHSQFVSDHFVCNTEVLFTGVGRQPHSTLPVVAQLFRKHPEFFSLFSTEYFKHDQTNTTEEWETSYNRARIGDWISSECAYNERDHQLELSREQFEHFVDGLVDYIVHDGYFISAPIIGDFINLYDTDYAVRLLTDQLGNGIRHTASVEYKITSLLACLDSAPAAIADGTCRYLGVDIMLGDLPDGATTVAKLSSYGDVGVKDGDGKWVGHFSLHELQATDPGTFRALVGALNLEDLFFPGGAEGEIPPHEKDVLAHEFSTAYQRYAADPFFDDCGVPLHTFPLKEQIGLIRLLRDGKATKPLADQVHTLGKNVLRIYALASAYNYTRPLEIPVVSPPEQQRFWSDLINMVDNVVDFVKLAETNAGILHTELRRSYPDIELNVEDVTHALIADTLHNLQTVKDVATLNEYQLNLAEQKSEITLGLEYFREIIGLGEKTANQRPINLREYRKRQNALTKFIKNPATKAPVIELLIKQKLVRPIPEISWEVDRDTAAYERRLGVNFTQWQQDKAAAGERPVTLELGPGSGVAKGERQTYDFAIADALYYNLGKFCQNLIDFEALQTAANITLTESDRKVIGEILYKMLVITPGEEASDQFTYNDTNIQGITNDPGVVIHLLQDQFPRLNSTVSQVPSTIAARKPDGTVFHPHKITFAAQTTGVQQALELLQQNGASYLRNDINPLSVMPLQPEGTIVGKFSEVVALLEPNQVDEEYGARGTVYERGTNWIALATQMTETLKDGGIWIDDSIRDNDGYRYRLPELSVLVNRLNNPNIHVAIVLGPPFPEEDYAQTELVPLSLVITKGDIMPDQKIGQYVKTPNELVDYADLMQRHDYLSKLSANNTLAHEISQAEQTYATAS